MNKYISLLAVTPLSVFFFSVSAQETEEVAELDPVIVTSTREIKSIEDLDTSITVISDTEIKKIQAQDLQDVFSYEPGINFESTGRVGIQDVRIRGIGDGRVLIRVDGMTLPDAYEFGPFQKSGRQRFDIANIKQAEVIRGPSSTLYGSRAIGGVVSIQTKDPLDYLEDGHTIGGNANIGYSGVNEAKYIGATVAGQFSDEFSAMLTLTQRNYHETEIHSGLGGIGRSREQNNPEDNTSTDILTKLVYQPNAQHQFTFTGTAYTQKTEADILSSQGVVSRGTTTHSYTGEDNKDRAAFTIRHDFEIGAPFADSGYWQLGYQDNKAVNDNKLVRTARGMNYTEYKNDTYESNSATFETQFNKYFNTGVSHELVYGLNYTQQDIETLRKNNRVTARGQVETSESNFPPSTVKEAGLFIQDRIGFAGGKFEVIPGIRYDNYKINPEADAAYLRASNNIPPKDFDESRVSFRLGGLYHINEDHSVFANYNQGFRAPAFNDANVGFSNIARGYRFIANPDLKPETSEGFELGWRANTNAVSSSLSAFYTEYDNFISQTSKFNPGTRLLEFQNINLDKTEIYGVEFSGALDLHQMLNAPDGLSLKGNIAYAKGHVKKTKNPISSIDPLSAVIGVSYDSPTGTWGAEAFVKASAAKTNNNISFEDIKSNSKGVAGYATLDLLAYYNINKNAKINLGIYNVFDKKYMAWDNVRGIPVSNRGNGETSPGRFVGINFNYDF